MRRNSVYRTVWDPPASASAQRWRDGCSENTIFDWLQAIQT